MQGAAFVEDGASPQESPSPPAAHPEDLRLARACAEGNAAAQATFDRDVLSRAVRVAARILPAAESRAELLQILRERLLLPGPERPARIGDYNGSVSLIAWTRIIAGRCALNLRKSQQRQPENIDDHLEQLGHSATPESALGQDFFREKFRAAFAAAVSALPSRDRAILGLHLVKGVTLEGVAAAYGVHRSTIVRWLAVARATLMERVREILASGLDASAADIESLLRKARSQLDVSISAAFRSLGK